MKIDSIALDNNGIYKLLSKTEPNYYNVFIVPNGIVNPEIDIEDLQLDCEINDLMMENLIIEYYDNEQEAKDRINKFLNEYEEYYYVVCYKNGKYITDNQKTIILLNGEGE